MLLSETEVHYDKKGLRISKHFTGIMVTAGQDLKRIFGEWVHGYKEGSGC